MAISKVSRGRRIGLDSAKVGRSISRVLVYGIILLLNTYASAAMLSEDDGDKKAQAAAVALARGDMEVFRNLTSEPQDANRAPRGLPMAYFAIQLRSDEALGHLLAMGADPNATVKNVTPLLVFALTSGFFEGAEQLIAAGADVNARHRGDGPWPLSFAIGAEQVELVRLLLENGANVSLTDSATGTTALHMAVRRQNEEMIRLLLEAGADPDAADKFGSTPRDAARVFGIEESLNSEGGDR